MSNTISKINLTTNAVTTITLGKEAADIAINPAGTFAYVATLNDGTIEKINLATNAVTTINIGAMIPWRVAINPAGTFAYVTASDATTYVDYLLKISLDTDTVTTMFGGPEDLRPLVFNPSGTFAYTQSNESNQVLKINLDTDFIDDAITAEPIPGYLAINPAGTFVYTTNGDGPTRYVSKINLSTKEVSKITFGSGIGGITINPAGTYAYLSIGNNTIAKLNLATDIVASVLDIGFNPRGLVFNPAGTFAYLLNEENSTISKIALTATEPQSIRMAWRNNDALSTIRAVPIRSASSRRKRRLSSEATIQPLLTASARHAASPRPIRSGRVPLSARRHRPDPNCRRAGRHGWRTSCRYTSTPLHR